MVPRWIEMVGERAYPTIAVLALDPDAAAFLEARGLGSMCIHDEQRYGVAHAASAWLAAGHMKSLLWVDLVEAGHRVLSVEMDQLLLRDVKPYIRLSSDFTGIYHDIVKDRNLGFIYFNPTGKTRSLLRELAERLAIPGAWDQPIFNELVNARASSPSTNLDEHDLHFHDCGHIETVNDDVWWGEESAFTPLVDAIHRNGTVAGGVYESRFAAAHLIGVPAHIRAHVFTAAGIFDPGLTPQSKGYVQLDLPVFDRYDQRHHDALKVTRDSVHMLSQCTRSPVLSVAMSCCPLQVTLALSLLLNRTAVVPPMSCGSGRGHCAYYNRYSIDKLNAFPWGIRTLPTLQGFLYPQTSRRPIAGKWPHQHSYAWVDQGLRISSLRNSL
jgi:hypothetical protein